MTDEHSAGADVTRTSAVAKARPADAPATANVVVRVFGRTDVGQVREHNEDSFLVEDLHHATALGDATALWRVDGRGVLFGVCDGMGGAATGEVASQLAVEIVSRAMRAGDAPRDRQEVGARLVAAIETAGREIFAAAASDRTQRGMGTTATVAALVGRDLLLGQVGDSRAYMLRGERLVQLTRDQSLVNQLIESGRLTEEEAETFEHNNIILQALGTTSDVDVDLTYVHLRRGDTLMLCSDGLSGMLRKDDLHRLLCEEDDPFDACRRLIDLANEAGGVDNITVIVARFDGDLADPTDVDVEQLQRVSLAVGADGARALR